MNPTAEHPNAAARLPFFFKKFFFRCNGGKFSNDPSRGPFGGKLERFHSVNTFALALWNWQTDCLRVLKISSPKEPTNRQKRVFNTSNISKSLSQEIPLVSRIFTSFLGIKTLPPSCAEGGKILFFFPPVRGWNSSVFFCPLAKTANYKSWVRAAFIPFTKPVRFLIIVLCFLERELMCPFSSTTAYTFRL